MIIEGYELRDGFWYKTEGDSQYGFSVQENIGAIRLPDGGIIRFRQQNIWFTTFQSLTLRGLEDIIPDENLREQINEALYKAYKDIPTLKDYIKESYLDTLKRRTFELNFGTKEEQVPQLELELPVPSSEPVTVPEIESISAKVERLKADIANSVPLTENLASNLNPIGRKARMAERTAREKKLAEAVSELMGVIGSEDAQVTKEDRIENLTYILQQGHAKAYILQKFPEDRGFSAILKKEHFDTLGLDRKVNLLGRLMSRNLTEAEKAGIIHILVSDFEPKLFADLFVKHQILRDSFSNALITPPSPKP